MKHALIVTLLLSGAAAFVTARRKLKKRRENLINLGKEPDIHDPARPDLRHVNLYD